MCAPSCGQCFRCALLEAGAGAGRALAWPRHAAPELAPAAGGGLVDGGADILGAAVRARDGVDALLHLTRVKELGTQ
eukprot:scaffold118899_cov63-Phaeocystis_antarctica.AAC.7